MMNGQRLFVAALCLIGVFVCSAAMAGTIYSLPSSISSNPDELRVVDTADGSTLSTVTMTSGGGAILGGTGLAVDPTSNVMYAVLQIGSTTAARTLVTVDPNTGNTSTIGSLTEDLLGIAFDAGGTLYGTLDDTTAPPSQETLVTVNTGTAAIGFFLVLGNGGPGEAIAYNSDDGLMYHASGQSSAGNILDSKIFESIDLSIPAVSTTTTIPNYAPGTNPEMITALAYAGGADFYMADRVSGDPAGSASGFWTIDTGGSTTYVGPMDHYSNGLAVVIPEPTSMGLLLAGLCVGALFRRRK